MASTRTIDSALSEAEKERILALFRQLTDRPDAQPMFPPFSNGTMIVAEDDSRIVGMATVSFYDAPSGRKAWLEDFVVDASCGGKGIGRTLLNAVTEHARLLGAGSLNLTSSPFRKAAHALYASFGMQQRDTDVFKLILKK